MQSHIIPKFFGKEFKKRTNSQTLVDGINPHKNPKPQDITKLPLLCGPCELLISKDETAFRNRLMPANKSLLCPIPYGQWLLRFAVSVSWRVLMYLKHSQPYSADEIASKEIAKFLPALPAAFHDKAEEALEIWRLFLLGKRTDVSPYDQHFVLLSGKNFPHENANALAFTIFQEDGMVATHTLMAQFIILGFITQSKAWRWEGTRIDRLSGQIGLPQTIPSVYGNWLARMLAEFEKVSVEDWNRRNKKQTKNPTVR